MEKDTRHVFLEERACSWEVAGKEFTGNHTMHKHALMLFQVANSKPSE
jgi:hypothetical protein